MSFERTSTISPPSFINNQIEKEHTGFKGGSPSISISVSHVSKCYEIYDSPRDRLKQFVLPHIQRALGKTPQQYCKEFWALQEISCQVQKGETVAIVGRNGSGKSTLLQIITGMLSPSSGHVDTTGCVAALLELGAGFNPEFTGRENVYLNATVLGLSKEEVDDRFGAIAAFAGIGDFIDRPTKTYSSGMLVRLAFAVNTCIEPEVLIVDEALSVGDAPFQAKCFKRLRQLTENGTSILFVSHDISTVRTICQRALWLNQGRAEMWGDAKDVVKEYERFCWLEQGVYLGITGDEIEGHATQEDDRIDEMLTGTHSKPSSHWVEELLIPLESSDRFGNNHIKIKNFEIKNSAGDNVVSCGYGEELRFVYYLEVCADVHSSFIVGLILRNTKGVDIYSATNFNDDKKFSLRKGQKFVATAKLKLHLTHQDYIIQIGLVGFKDGERYVNGQYDFSRAIVFDCIEKAMVLTVEQNQPEPLQGPVHEFMDFEIELA